MKRTIAILVIVALMVPLAAYAGQAPGASNSQVGRSMYGESENSVTEYRDNRGVVSWANNLFWYQLYNFYRWSLIWRL